MWTDKLKKVHEKGNTYSLLCVKPGVPDEIINNWTERVQYTLGVRLPKAFIDVLRYANGFEWNGFILYGVDQTVFPDAPTYTIYGLIDQNEIWYEVEDQRAYLFLGESNISWYAYEIATERYIELDNPSGREVAAFDSFEEMLEKLLDDSLA